MMDYDCVRCALKENSYNVRYNYSGTNIAHYWVPVSEIFEMYQKSIRYSYEKLNTSRVSGPLDNLIRHSEALSNATENKTVFKDAAFEREFDIKPVIAVMK